MFSKFAAMLRSGTDGDDFTPLDRPDAQRMMKAIDSGHNENLLEGNLRNVSSNEQATGSCSSDTVLNISIDNQSAEKSGNDITLNPALLHNHLCQMDTADMTFQKQFVVNTIACCRENNSVGGSNSSAGGKSVVQADYNNRWFNGTPTSVQPPTISDKFAMSEDDSSAVSSVEHKTTNCVDVKLSELIRDTNLCVVMPIRNTMRHAEPVFKSVFKNDRSVLFELVLIVNDPQWRADRFYVEASLEEMAPNQSSVTKIGCYQVVYSRCAAQRARIENSAVGDRAKVKSEMKRNMNWQKQRVCRMEQYSGVENWCAKCGLQPRQFTLYQNSLPPDQIHAFAHELANENGTHGDIADAPGCTQQKQQQFAANLVKKNTSSGECRLEVDAKSTVGHAGGMVVVAGNKRTAFIDKSAWNQAVDRSVQSTLAHVALVNPEQARLRLKVYSDCIDENTPINITVVVQCMGVVY